MTALIDELGHRFGRLEVLANSGIRQRGARLWTCRCDCGNLTFQTGGALRSGFVQSCGCQKIDSATKHGLNLHYLYPTWSTMIRRCNDPTSKDYKDYGAKGVTVCERWSGYEGVANFIADMGDRPDGYTLDRMDPYGNYEPSNCRWATRVQQRHNRRAS